MSSEQHKHIPVDPPIHEDPEPDGAGGGGFQPPDPPPPPPPQP